MEQRTWLPLALGLALFGCAQNPARPVEAVREVSAQELRDAEVQRLFDAAFEEGHEPEAALASLDAALTLDPDYAPAHFERGVLLANMDEPVRALTAYAEVERLDPDYTDLHYNRGVCHTELGAWPEALEAYDRAIAANPEFAWAHTNRAEALIRLRRFADAQGAAEAAIELDRDDTLAYQLHGVAHLNGGDPQKAYDSFQVCVEREPDNASHCFNSGLALEDLGRSTDALMAYSMARMLDPDHSSAQAAVQRLRDEMFPKKK